MARFTSTQAWAIPLGPRNGCTNKGPFASITEAKRHMREVYGEHRWERDWNGTDWVGDSWYITPNEPKQ